MASFSTRELYGGAINVDLPTNFIDASNLRQVPDHQEIYLSSKTLTSITIEINQYVSPSIASETNVDPSAITSTAEAGGNKAAIKPSDKAAAIYHLQDLIDPEDTLAEVSTPKAVQMKSPSVRGLPAFILRGKVAVRERDRRAPSLLPQADQNAPPGMIQTTTTIRLLLIRLEAKATDLCVMVNVPWKELEVENKVDEEENFADALLEHVISSLDIKEFGLFGE